MNQAAQNWWQGDQSDSEEAQPHLVAPAVGNQGGEDAPDDEPSAISWQASEYILHEKDPLWFVALLAGTVVLVALSIFLIKAWTFTALIVVMAIAVLVFARRPPRTLTYRLSPYSLHINERRYALHEFRAFGVVQEGALYSIMLLPVKRFMPAVTLYFPVDQGEQIVDLLGETIPMETIKLDPIEKLVRKLRF